MDKKGQLIIEIEEPEIHDKEECYRLLAQNMGHVIWTMDMELNYSYMSPSVERIRGFSAEEVMTRRIQDNLTPSSLETALQVFADELALEEKEERDLSRVRTLEVEQFCKDGSTVWTELNMTFLRDERDQAVGILGVTRDITDRKRREEGIRKSESKYKSLIENMKDIIFLIDPGGKIIFSNPSSERILGYKNEEMINKNVIDFIPVEERKRVIEAVAKGMAGQNLSQFQTRAITKSGYRVILEVNPSRVWEKGKAVGALLIARDISSRKLSEQKLRNREEFIRATLEATADGILAMDEKGHTIQANSRFAEMWRIPEEIIQSKGDMKLLNSMMDQLEDPQAFFLQIQELFVNLKESFDTLEFKDGRVFEHQSCPLVRDGEIAGRVWSFSDITKRKLAERALESKSAELEDANQKLMELDELKDNFLSMVSHDLRTPMTGIMAYAQIMREGTGKIDDESQKKYLGIILRQGDRLTRLINDLLDIQRFEAGRMAMEFEELDLAQLITESLDAFQGVSNEKNIALDKDLADRQIIISGVRDRLHQVMANLLSNAFKFTPAEGRIVVSAQMSPEDGEGMVKVCVIDTGPGIAPELHGKLFDKFQQVDKMVKEKTQGSGLGLALVREIIDCHNGSVGVKSAPGQGSTFYFTLPIKTDLRN